MVGVAGKSKACHDCKRRRVKCGLEQPQCQRCINAGLSCRGYSKATTYVNRSLECPQTTANDVLVSQVSVHRTDQILGDALQSYERMSRLLKSSTYSRIEFRKLGYLILRLTYLPEDGLIDTTISKGSIAWLEAVCGLEVHNQALDLSLLAFCSTQLYTTGASGVTLSDALSAYSVALQHLSSALPNTATADVTPILGSIVLLSTCELFICPGQNGWKAHVQGTAYILKQKPVDGHWLSTEAWVSLCARVKTISVLSNMMSGSAGMLSAAEWREILSDQLDDDPMDSLLNIAIEICALLGNNNPSMVHVSCALQLLERIHAWERTLHGRDKAAACRLVPSRMSNPVDLEFGTRRFDEVYEFSSISMAGVFTVCWATSLRVLLWLIDHVGLTDKEPTLKLRFDAIRIAQSHGPESFEDSIRKEAQLRASQICRSVEYILRIETNSIRSGTYGPQNMTFAGWAVRQFYGRSQMYRELAWFQNASRMTGPGRTRVHVRTIDFEP